MPVKKPKYQAGDYISHDESVFLKISAVLFAEDMSRPIYMTSYLNVTAKKQFNEKWCTEYELDKEGYVKAVPDFDTWKTLENGQMLKTGHTDDAHYVKVLARVGDAVLLSGTPHNHKDDDLYKLAEQLAELTGKSIEEDMPKDVKEELRQHNSMSHMHSVATNWYDLDHLALMNWQIIGE